MNLIAVIILVTIGIDFILNAWADHLNLKRLRPELPESFKGVYEPEQYRKSQEYLRVNTRFGWITGTFNVVLILVFWFAEGFQMLDQWVRSLSLSPIFSGLIFIGILTLVKGFISLPFSIYATFVIEERFGFNKTTWSTFILDLLKGLMLVLLLGTPLLSGIMFFFEYAGEYAWLFCWIGITLYMLAVQFIAPTWIMPLFNKFTTLEAGELKSAILEYAKSIKFPVRNVFVIDGSRRSNKSNAFFTGFGKNKMIALFDTLIKRHSVKELVAVLAHEMGHYKKKHILLGMILGILQTGLMLYLLSFFISYQGLFDAFYMDRPSVYAGLIFFAMLFSPLDFFIGMFMQMFSRRNETQADRFAVDTTGDPRAMADALKKLSAHNLTNLTPHPFYVFLNYSHPPVLQRIKDMNRVG
jgi:STE24 endopeptidase